MDLPLLSEKQVRELLETARMRKDTSTYMSMPPVEIEALCMVWLETKQGAL